MLLRRVCPGREFTPGEIEAANIVLGAMNATADAKLRIPRRFVPVGGFYVKDGVSYECVPRGEVGCVRDACKGCAFCRTSSSDRWCLGLQCSMWDREDGRDVWFVVSEGDDDE